MADRAGESDGQPARHGMQHGRRADRAGLAAPMMSVRVYASFDVLPERLVAFLDAAAADNFFCGIPWFRTLLQTAGPSADEPCIYVAESGGRPAAVLFARERKAAGRLKAHMLLGPSHGLNAPIYAPVLDPELGAAGLRAIVAAMIRTVPPFHVLRFDSLDRDAPEFAALAAALRGRGLLVQRFFNFQNYFEDVRGLTIERYLARRSRQTRYHIGRHVRRLARSGRGRIEVVQAGPELKPALIDYALVDLQSWKDQEAYPDVIPTLAQAAAGSGALRLGLLYIDDEPAAAQVWIVSAGRATLLRMHHVREYAHLSPGTVLTFEMLRRILAVDAIREVDFGAGDEPFKRKWLAQSRERVGLLAFNPRTVKGLLAAARHIGGHAAMSLARRMRSVLRHLLGRNVMRQQAGSVSAR